MSCTLGNEKPQLKDIDNFVVIQCATHWKQLGKNLGVREDLLEIIAFNNERDCESCCSKMLIEWLDSNPNASWKILLNAIDKTQNELPETVEEKDTMADELNDTIKKLNTTTERLPVVTEKLDDAANKIPVAVATLDNAAKELPRVVSQLSEAAYKLSKPVSKTHIAEDISVNFFAGNKMLAKVRSRTMYI